MKRLTNFDGALFVMDKTLVYAMSLVIPVSWILLARHSDISVVYDPRAIKSTVREQVSPLIANTEMTCKNVFSLDGFRQVTWLLLMLFSIWLSISSWIKALCFFLQETMEQENFDLHSFIMFIG